MIGTGATGIQVIQTIAPEVGHMKVFIRTPQYSIPMKNPKYGPVEHEWYHNRFAEIRDTVRTPSPVSNMTSNTPGPISPGAAARAHQPDLGGRLAQALARLLRRTVLEQEASDVISQFVREKIEARLQDPELIDALVPQPGDYGFGTHRVPLERGYYEAFHQDNVEAVNVRNNPITRITSTGIELEDGSHHEVDVIVMATGFDAGTGSLTRIDLRGRGGRSLAEEWGRTSVRRWHHDRGLPNLLNTESRWRRPRLCAI